jgi:sporulation protein YlmC with PRC-barrel domain
MATLENPGDTTGSLIAASKVNGTSVYNPAGDKLGSIYDVMLEKGSGKASYAIMSFGGFLGIGEQYHPLPWNQLTYAPSMGGYVVRLDRRQLEGGPAYSARDVGTWDEGRARAIDDYYGGYGGGEPVAGAPGALIP